MTWPGLRLEEPTGVDGGDLLVLGHSLGTSAALWDDALPALRERFRVARWELPGHGDAPAATGAYRVEELTDALVARLDARATEAVHYAGVSIAGCVGLDLCLRHPERVISVAVISSGARVDDPALMRARADTARARGMGPFVESFRDRWFATTTPAATRERLLGILSGTDAESYARAAEALADFDVWDLVPRIRTPLLAVGGEADRSVPLDRSRQLAARVPHGVATAIPDAAHSLVAENPAALAAALTAFIDGSRPA